MSGSPVSVSQDEHPLTRASFSQTFHNLHPLTSSNTGINDNSRNTNNNTLSTLNINNNRSRRSISSNSVSVSSFSTKHSFTNYDFISEENEAQILQLSANAMKNSNNSPKLKNSIFDKSLNAYQHKSVSLCAFSHLFCELIQYSQQSIHDVTQLEAKLAEIGYSIGCKQLSLMSERMQPGKRHKSALVMLDFVKNRVWKHLFGKFADDLQQSNNENEFFIIDSNPITNKYISVPESMGDFNPASFIAGIIHGIMESAGFPCNVYAHDPPLTKQDPKQRTVYIVKLQPKMRFGGIVQQ